jgi:DNA-binding SARP family transcriptional activator
MKKLQPEAPEIRSTESLFPQLNKMEVQQPAHEIITEAMAEVYLKQGLKEKAIEVYNKLSLQNPANKHIFAAKLSLIKENNL